MSGQSRALARATGEGGFFRLVRRWLHPVWLFNRKVEVTRGGYVFLSLIFVIGLAAFNTGNNLLYLVLSMMIAALFLSFMLSEYVISKIQISRTHAGTVTAGQEITVSYRVENKNRVVPSFAIRINDRLAGAELSSVAVYVRAKDEVKTRARTVVPRRGRLKFQETTISTRAPFGWFKKTKRAAAPGELIALPASRPLDLDEEEMLSRGDERPLSRRGHGDELFGFREYRRGDHVKDIHWKTSARLRKLVLRERELEQENKLRIAIEPKPGRDGRPDPATEAAIVRAASLARAAIEQGWLVRIEVRDRGVDFGSGPGHLHELLRFLALFDAPELPAGSPLPPTDHPAVTLP